MANILEFLRSVLTDIESQRLFRADPEGYVARSGFGDLTGEDVVEGIVVLRRSLSPDIAGALGDFEDERRLPPIRPAFDERELDAALRQLHHAVDLVSGAGAPAAPPPPPPAMPTSTLFSPVHDEPIPVEVEPELIEPEPRPFGEPAPPMPEPEPVHHHEPIAVEPSPSFTEPAPSVAAPAPSAERPGGAELRARLEALTDDLVDHLAAIIDDAERYADDVRARADRDAQELREQANTDREDARRVLLDARDEADRIRTEAAAGTAELESRRAALREAERELKERLAGLDNVFRSVLKDE